LGGTDWGSVDIGGVQRAIGIALDLGSNLFDTADVYGLGASEVNLARALGPRRHEAVIVTKFGFDWDSSAPGRARTFLDVTPARAEKAIAGSLRRLGVDSLPVLLAHRAPENDEAVRRLMSALADAKERRLVRGVGVSHFSLSQLSLACTICPVDAVELELNLLHQADRALVDFCGHHGIAVLAYAPLAQGALSMRHQHLVFASDDRRSRLSQFRPEAWRRNRAVYDALRTLARERNVTPAEVAIAWVLAKSFVTCCVIGVRSESQVRSAHHAHAIMLTSSEVAMLDDARMRVQEMTASCLESTQIKECDLDA
jgi:aryl-alcohol dehydrogenase-like predicted oxidoreductase